MQSFGWLTIALREAVESIVEQDDFSYNGNQKCIVPFKISWMAIFSANNGQEYLRHN